MTCPEVLELLPAAVDGQVGEELLSRLHLHLNECPPCLHEFELERLTKKVIRKHSRSTPSPNHLRTLIQNAIERERRRGDSSGTLPSFSRRFPRNAVFALGGVGALALLLVVFWPMRSTRHSHVQPTDADVVHQTYNNFDRVLEGSMRPDIMTDDPQRISAFFKPTVDFNVKIPTMRQYKLLGAIHSKYNGRCIAQLVYRGVQDVVYVYEVNFQAALRSDAAFKIPPRALAELKRTGMYIENHIPDCSLVMWIEDSTLCCAVADVGKEELLSSLAEFR